MNCNKIILGTAQFGLEYGISNNSGKVDEKEVINILNLASDVGINTLDTAVNYGRSQKVISKAKLKNFNIISKFPKFPNYEINLSKWMDNMIDLILDDLNLDCIHGLLAHDAKDFNSEISDELYSYLTEQKAKGKIHKLGLSIYNTMDLENINSRYKFDIIQGPCNIIDNNINSLKSQEVNMEAEIHGRSIFLQGLLLLEKEQRPKKFKKFEKIFDKISEKFDEIEMTPIEACLSYVTYNNKIDKFLVGVNSSKELKEIINVRTEDIDIKFENSMPKELINPNYWDSL